MTNLSPDLIAENLARAVANGEHPNPGVAATIIICCIKCDSAKRFSTAPLLDADSVESIIATASILGFPGFIIQFSHGKHQGELSAKLIEFATTTKFLGKEELKKMRDAFEALRTVETDSNGRIRLDKAINTLGMLP